LRIDGRRLYDFRLLKITFGEDPGNVFVQLGRTRYELWHYPLKRTYTTILFFVWTDMFLWSVFACTVCGVTQPHEDRPTEGFFTLNVEFSPMASPKYGGGR
jgi:exosome complex RNA-binding protein Rrp42 (RNase PH superfamily)